MDWITEKCDRCGKFQVIGTKEEPAIFAIVWSFKDGQKVCPKCKPLPGLGYTMRRHMPIFPVLSMPGIFVNVGV